MLPLRHLITNLISGTYIFSFYFVLLRRALPLYVTYTVSPCHMQLSWQGSSQTVLSNQNMVRDYFSQLPYKAHQSFMLLFQEGYVIKDWNLSLPKTVVSSFGSTIQCQLQAQNQKRKSLKSNCEKALYDITAQIIILTYWVFETCQTGHTK